MKKETLVFLNGLTRAELREVNKFAYEKLKILTALEASCYAIGASVTWAHKGERKTGIVTKTSSKCVFVTENSNGQRWKIGPSNLSLVE